MQYRASIGSAMILLRKERIQVWHANEASIVCREQYVRPYVHIHFNAIGLNIYSYNCYSAPLIAEILSLATLYPWSRWNTLWFVPVWQMKCILLSNTTSDGGRARERRKAFDRVWPWSTMHNQRCCSIRTVSRFHRPYACWAILLSLEGSTTHYEQW
jgi:hypothetical protein